MSTNKNRLALALMTLLLPSMAHAYVNPYDVLLSNELLLPAQPREASDRVSRQQSESAARRDAEQAAIFAEQHPAAAEEWTEEEEALHGAATEQEMALSDEPVNREFLELMRTLERITDTQAKAKAEAEIRQQAFLLLEEQGIELHGGAPLLPGPTGKGKPLPPTGAGTAAGVMTLIGGAVWTILRARRTERMTRVVS
jgi:flagellar biosynthesis GTPase FlhF